MSGAEVIGIVSLIVGSGTAINGFLFRQIFNRLGKIEAQLNKTLVEMPEKYTSSKDFHECEKRKTEDINDHDRRLRILEQWRAAKNGMVTVPRGKE